VTDEPGGGVALAVRGLSVSYAGVPAVAEADLDLVEGRVLAVLGPSGCGKSTLLRAVAGLEDTAGTVAWHGTDLSRTPTHKRGFALMFQDGQLFGQLTVARNVAYPLRLRRTPRAASDRRVADLLDLVGLSELAGRLPATLSGGERQRVALARALAASPRLLLLDEPLSALDLKLRKAMRYELKRLQHATGITTIYVTHDQEEALSMSDRIVVMNGGLVEQIAAPAAIYHQPASAFVADFIGESNFVQGRVSAIEPSSVAVTTADGLVLRVQASQTLRRDQEAFVSVRPEKAHLSMQPPSDTPANIFPVTVERVSYIGSDTRILVQMGQERVFSVWEQNTRSTLDRGAYWQRGEQGYLWWPLENGLVLTE